MSLEIPTYQWFCYIAQRCPAKNAILNSRKNPTLTKHMITSGPGNSIISAAAGPVRCPSPHPVTVQDSQCTFLAQEPALYRLYEAINHNGHSLKALINEKFGDGIMSAIDFYISVDKMKGLQGEDRVVITMNGGWPPVLFGLPGRL
jgi:hypothetical protein